MRKISVFAFSVAVLLALTCCSRVNYGYLRGDVIGFRQDAVTSYDAAKGIFKNNKPQKESYNLMSEEGKGALLEFIDTEIPRDLYTSAYYAMELACDHIKYIRQHETGNDRFTKYYIFLLTDGLDNSSEQAAKNAGQHLIPVTTEDYPAHLQKKLRKAMGGSRNTFEVYPMLYEGEDIKGIKSENNMTQEAYEAYIRSKFECFRYSSRGNAPELIFGSDYKKIFSDMRERFYSSSYDFRIPKSYAGRKVKMRFVSDKGKVAELQGFFRRQGGSYTLEDIAVSGMSINMNENQYSINHNTGLAATNEEDSTKSNVYFHIEELQLEGKAFVVGEKAEDVKQYYQDNGLWIINSEYNTEQSLNIDTYFIIVIDGSRSLDGRDGKAKGFENEKGMARDIIEMVLKPTK